MNLHCDNVRFGWDQRFSHKVPSCRKGYLKMRADRKHKLPMLFRQLVRHRRKTGICQHEAGRNRQSRQAFRAAGSFRSSQPPAKLSGTFELFTSQNRLSHTRYRLAPFATRIVLAAVVRLLAISGCLVSMVVVACLIIESERRRLSRLSAFISRNKVPH